MASTIQIKRGTGSAVPSGLADGELAINLDDGQLYFGSGSNSVTNFTFGSLNATSLNVTSITSSIVTSSIVLSEGSNTFGDAITDTQIFNGHITASGNISSSGNIIAASLDAAAVSDTLAAAIIAEIDNDEIPIAKLAEDAVTVTAGTGLTGGGSITLGGSATVNLIGGDGITANANDMAITAAQTTITSILAADVKIGEDDETKIDFETADEIHFYANNAQEMVIQANVVAPGADDGTALGDADQRWSDLFLAEGGVINFDNGDVTITQTGNNLAIAGTTGTNFVGHITASSNISASGNIIGPNLIADSASFSTRTTALEGNGVFTAAGISGSFVAPSASFSTRVTAAEVITGKTLISSSLQAFTNITASGNISASGTIIGLAAQIHGNSYVDGKLGINATTQPPGVFEVTGDSNFIGHITASGNISASGNIIGPNLIADSASFSTRVTLNDAKVTNADQDLSALALKTGISGSFTEPSASISTRLTTAESTTANRIFNHITASGNISSSGTITGNSIVGTLGTAAQTNITSLGTLSALTVDNLNLNDTSISSTADGDVYLTIGTSGFDFEANAGDKFLYNAQQNNVDLQYASENDQNVFYIDASTDNVGIGDATPTAKLDVVGNINTTSHITASGNISSSGTITANAFVGNITGDLTGEADTVATIAGLAPNTATTQATQGAITSVGTLSALTVSGDITANGDIVGDDVTDITNMRHISANRLIAAAGGVTSQITLSDGGMEIIAGSTTFTSNITGSILNNVNQNIYNTGSLALNANSAFGDIVKFGFTTTVAGGVYFLNGTGGWTLTQANAAATSTGSLAVAVGTNSTIHGMCLRGFANPFTDPSAGIGNPVYLSDTHAGRILAAPPSSTNDVVRIVGYQYGPDLIYFNPSNDFIIHA